MKEDKYTKSLAKNQVYAIVHLRGLREKRFTQIYKTLYGDTMFVSLSGEQNNIGAGNQQKHLFLSFPIYREFFT